MTIDLELSFKLDEDFHKKLMKNDGVTREMSEHILTIIKPDIESNNGTYWHYKYGRHITHITLSDKSNIVTAYMINEALGSWV